ncbi:MAG: hypothetical protein ACE5JL_10360 [Dehalococcoidia bacterium]
MVFLSCVTADSNYRFQTPCRSLASGHLAVEVTGPDSSDTVALRLDRLEQSQHTYPDEGALVRQINDVGNGTWEEPFHLREGTYALVSDAPGYVSRPRAITFEVPEEGITWRYDSLGFEVFRSEKAVDAVSWQPEQGQSGAMAGLPEGVSATVQIERLPMALG